MLSELLDLFFLLRLEGPSGIVILGCVALYIPAWAVLVWRGAGRETPFVAAFVALFGVGAIGGGLALVASSRRALLEDAGMIAQADPSRTDPYGVMEPWYPMQRGNAGLLVLATALLTTGVLGMVLAARRALSPAPPRPLSLSLWMGAFTVAGALSIPLLQHTIVVLQQEEKRTVSVPVLGELVS